MRYEKHHNRPFRMSMWREWRQRFSKAYVFAVHTNMIGLCFKMSSLWTAFSNVGVFEEKDERFQSI